MTVMKVLKKDSKKKVKKEKKEVVEEAPAEVPKKAKKVKKAKAEEEAAPVKKEKKAKKRKAEAAQDTEAPPTKAKKIKKEQKEEKPPVPVKAKKIKKETKEEEPPVPVKVPKKTRKDRGQGKERMKDDDQIMDDGAYTDDEDEDGDRPHPQLVRSSMDQENIERRRKEKKEEAPLDCFVACDVNELICAALQTRWPKLQSVTMCKSYNVGFCSFVTDKDAENAIAEGDVDLSAYDVQVVFRAKKSSGNIPPRFADKPRENAAVVVSGWSLLRHMFTVHMNLDMRVREMRYFGSGMKIKAFDRDVALKLWDAGPVEVLGCNVCVMKPNKFKNDPNVPAIANKFERR